MEGDRQGMTQVSFKPQDIAITMNVPYWAELQGQEYYGNFNYFQKKKMELKINK